MGILVKNIIKTILAFLLLWAFALLLAEISDRMILSIGFFPSGVPTDVWLNQAISSVAPGSIWFGFWVSIICYVAWRVIWAVLYSRDLISAVNKVTVGFWLALLAFMFIQLVLVVIFLFRFEVMLWAATIGNFWVYLLPMAYIFPFAICLIFFSQVGVGPFQRRGVSYE